MKYDDFWLLNTSDNKAVITENENENKEESVEDTEKNENVQISLKFKKLDVLKDDSDMNLKISSSSVFTV